MIVRFVIFGIVMAVLQGCKTSADRGESIFSDTTVVTGVSWTFSPGESERIFLVTELKKIQARLDEDLLDGEVRRFGKGELDEERYLVVLLHKAGSVGESHVNLYVVVRQGEGRVSSVFDTGVSDDPAAFFSLGTADVDGDGLLDFIYCDATDSPRRKVVGFKDDDWYIVQFSPDTLRACAQ